MRICQVNSLGGFYIGVKGQSLSVPALVRVVVLSKKQQGLEHNTIRTAKFLVKSVRR